MKAKNVAWRVVSASLAILVLIIACVMIYRAGKLSYAFGYRVFTEPAVSSEENARDMIVTVTSDMSGKDIGDTLEDKGLVDSGLLFFVQLELSAYKDDIKPGTYTLSTSMTAREMMQVMSAEEEDTEEEES